MADKQPTNIERVSDLIDVDVQSGETVEIEEPLPTDTDIEVELNDDGSGTVNFFPEDEIKQQIPFNANLAEFMDEGELGALSSQIMADYEDDQSSREEWEDTYILSLIHI